MCRGVTFDYAKLMTFLLVFISFLLVGKVLVWLFYYSCQCLFIMARFTSVSRYKNVGRKQRCTKYEKANLCVIKHLFVRFLTNITFIQSREDNIWLAFGSSNIASLAWIKVIFVRNLTNKCYLLPCNIVFRMKVIYSISDVLNFGTRMQFNWAVLR